MRGSRMRHTAASADRPAHHSGRGLPLCLLQVMLSGGWDKTVQVWDQRAGPLAVRSLYGPFICGDALDLKGDRILTGDVTCTMLAGFADAASSNSIISEIFHL